MLSILCIIHYTNQVIKKLSHYITTDIYINDDNSEEETPEEPTLASVMQVMLESLLQSLQSLNLHT